MRLNLLESYYSENVVDFFHGENDIFYEVTIKSVLRTI